MDDAEADEDGCVFVKGIRAFVLVWTHACLLQPSLGARTGKENVAALRESQGERRSGAALRSLGVGRTQEREGVVV